MSSLIFAPAALATKSTWQSKIKITDPKLLIHKHVPGHVTYPTNLPTGGAHNALWQTCAFYSYEINNENAVHSLEHGAVWVTYKTMLSVAQFKVFANIATKYPYLLISLNPTQKSQVILTAWGLQYSATGFSDPAIASFIAKYEAGPQTPEPGATCAGGNSKPIGGLDLLQTT